MRSIFLALTLATAAFPAIALAAEPAQQAQASGYSVEGTDIGTLLDDPAAKAVLVKYMPALVSNDQIQMARSMTLKQIQGFAGDALSDELLGKVDSELKQLPAKH